jgi:hypothetical protein
VNAIDPDKLDMFRQVLADIESLPSVLTQVMVT